MKKKIRLQATDKSHRLYPAYRDGGEPPITSVQMQMATVAASTESKPILQQDGNKTDYNQIMMMEKLQELQIKIR